MQQSSLSAHGSSTADVSYNIDGATVNWPGGGGGATMIYYDQGMFEEVNYMTSAIPAEMLAGGVTINMVTKDGGNQWKGNLRYNFANDALQCDNCSETQAARADVPRQPDQQDLRLQPVTAAARSIQNKLWVNGTDPQVGRQQVRQRHQRRRHAGARRQRPEELLGQGRHAADDQPEADRQLLLERQDSRPSPRQQRHHSRHRLGRADQPGADDAGEVHRHSRHAWCSSRTSASWTARRTTPTSRTPIRRCDSHHRHRSRPRSFNALDARRTSAELASPVRQRVHASARAAWAASTCSRPACSGAVSTTPRTTRC